MFFCKQDEKFNKRTLFDDFLIFIPLKLPTMVILKQQNTVKRVLFCVVAYVLRTICRYYYVFCKKDERLNKRTLFDDFLINFIHLNLPTMVILMENMAKSPLLSCRGFIERLVTHVFFIIVLKNVPLLVVVQSFTKLTL